MGNDQQLQQQHRGYEGRPVSASPLYAVRNTSTSLYRSISWFSVTRKWSRGTARSDTKCPKKETMPKLLKCFLAVPALQAVPRIPRRILQTISVRANPREHSPGILPLRRI